MAKLWNSVMLKRKAVKASKDLCISGRIYVHGRKGGITIGEGVTIGNHSVIGAGSVVARDVPDNEVWAGNPARFIMKLGGGLESHSTEKGNAMM